MYVKGKRKLQKNEISSVFYLFRLENRSKWNTHINVIIIIITLNERENEQVHVL